MLNDDLREECMRLRAENKRLRKALTDISHLSLESLKDLNLPDDSDSVAALAALSKSIAVECLMENPPRQPHSYLDSILII